MNAGTPAPLPLATMPPGDRATSRVVALVGNPNAGKTTLFNTVTGLRAKTANFPGTTVEHRTGRLILQGGDVQLIDMPGLYSIDAVTAEERIARDALLGNVAGLPAPQAIVLLVDASNLERNLYLASQVLDLGIPTVVALNMVDLADRDGIRIDAERLALELGCPVVPIVARDGHGVEELKETLGQALQGAVGPRSTAPDTTACACTSCPFAARYDWAETVGKGCTSGVRRTHGDETERLDRVLTHPVVGVAAFLSVMFSVFALIFWVAQYPMDWIDSGFAFAGSLVADLLPAGDFRSLLVDGVVGGVGGVVIFLPQICILFFFLAILEDTGYLSRAAFVMDRLMRRVGLPGKAFVPMVSAHACAIPAIMSTRVIEDRRERLLTILVLPLFTCSARIPVYAMVTALLFADQPLLAALLFTGAYALGIVAALVMATFFRHSLLPGEAQPLVLELPRYKRPSLKTALLTTWDRGAIFLRNAGTLILLFSIGMWVLANYPASPAPEASVQLSQQADRLRASQQDAEADSLQAQADVLARQHRLANSVAGRLGHFIEPAIRPLGFDWQIGVGLLSSFAAREVIVSTMAIVYGVGDDALEDGSGSLYDTLRNAKRSDGGIVFTPATSVSLLIFYVLAMQCVPTLAVARREANSWKVPLFQLTYMTVLAYTASLVTYQTLAWFGFAAG